MTLFEYYKTTLDSYYTNKKVTLRTLSILMLFFNFVGLIIMSGKPSNELILCYYLSILAFSLLYFTTYISISIYNIKDILKIKMYILEYDSYKKELTDTIAYIDYEFSKVKTILNDDTVYNEFVSAYEKYILRQIEDIYDKSVDTNTIKTYLQNIVMLSSNNSIDSNAFSNWLDLFLTDNSIKSVYKYKLYKKLFDLLDSPMD